MFNRILSAKKEFRDHSAEPVRRGDDLEGLWKEACSSEQFELTHAQLFLRNFMNPHTPYNGVLLFHGVGVGKTCSAITIAEQFDGARVLVLTRPGLMDGFRKQIFDGSKVSTREDGALDLDAVTQCTGTKYTDQLRERALTKDALERGVSRLISARYSIMGTLKFANVIEGLGEGDAALERIRSRYSNMIIIVDEAHHLRGEDSKRAANALRRVLRVTDGTRVVLLTATPMFNDTADIVHLVNLLRINDKRPPVRPRDFFDRIGNLTQQGEAKLVEACRGYISYMRGDNPFSFPVRLSPSINRDSSIVPPTKLPVVDVKGQPIPPAERIHRLELVCSRMSTVQRTAYRMIEDRIIEHISAPRNHAGQAEDEEDEVDDLGEEDENKRPNAMSMGIDICNIAYPAPGGGATFGRVAGFQSVFVNVSNGRQLQVRYRPGTPPLLAMPHLKDQSPKIAAILNRVLSSEGVVMIYSRWIWSGLVPMAIALEHAGFSRFDGSQMLVGSDKNITHGAPHRYAIISGQREVASDMQSTVDALRSAENIDGSRIKVVLISDKGSEGLDLRFVREVHVMEPWYHMNKVEQIVGRAARHCTSHSDMPPDKRNVTVYLHALIDGNRETVDLRAYRIAELKQTRIVRVETLLRDNAIDCIANRARLYYDVNALGISVDVVTSQGTRVRGFRMGDSERSGYGLTLPPPKCNSPSGATAAVVDESTYDTAMHAHHLYAYRRIMRDMFASGKYQATYEQIWDYVSKRFSRAKREMLSAALDEIIDGRISIIDRNGRRGRMLYRWDVYVFQPDEADTAVLTEHERERPASTDRRLSLLLADDNARPTSATTPGAPDIRRTSSSRRSPATADSLPVWGADALDELLRQRRQALLDAVPPALSRALFGAALDAAIDRLSSVEVWRTCASLLHARESGTMTDTERHALRSLEHARVLLPGGVVRNPYAPDDIHCFDPSAGHLRRCGGGDGSLFAAAAKAARTPADLIAAMIVPVPEQDRTVLKVHAPGTTIDRGGCVCHQTSTLTAQDLTRLSRSAIGASSDVSKLLSKGVIESLDKRSLCTLYELLLRRFRPKTILRPIDSVDHQRQVKAEQDQIRKRRADADQGNKRPIRRNK